MKRYVTQPVYTGIYAILKIDINNKTYKCFFLL